MNRCTAVLLMLLAPCAWAEGRCIPSYWEQSRYLSVSPTTGGVESALLNPAAWALLRGPEALFQWSDLHASRAQARMWLLGVGVPYLGFGAQRWTAPGEESTEMEVTDYQVALAMGGKSEAFGIAYGWSKGDTDAWRRPKLLTLGTAWRPSRWLSLGTSTTFALGERHRRMVTDVGLRPLGHERLTVFAEAVLHENESLRDAGWAAGAIVEPLDGFRVSCRLVHPNAGDGGTPSTTAQLGFGLSLGDVAGWIQPRYDEEDELEYTSYSVRLGYPQPSVLDALLERNKSYLKLNLKGRLRYRPSRWFEKDAHHFLDMLRYVREASEDPRVAGVVLNISGLKGSWEMCWELREELARMRQVGKKVVVFMDNGGMKEYYLASVADELVLDPEAVLLLTGLTAGRTYYKDALEKLGVGFREFRHFRYKSAGEALSRRDMSKADRQQLQAIVDDFYAEVRGGVCAARLLTPAQFDSLIDNVAAFTADQAVRSDLADTVARWGDVKGIVKVVEGGGKRLATAPELRRSRPKRDVWGPKPEVAIIYALGPCAMDEGIAARRLARTIRKAREDESVKAVVFRADSPGGDVIPSDIVAEELAKTSEKKPVLVSQGQVAGSGGYWISMNGDRIVTSPFTVTGSIGVAAGWVWNKGLGSKLGLTADHVKVGRHADLGFGITLPLLGIRVPDRDMTKGERGAVKRLMNEVYQEFLEKVAAARHMSSETVDSLGQGRVWSGRDAVHNGLVDQIGGLLTTADLARKAAGIAPDLPAEFREMPPRPLFPFGLTGGPSVSTTRDAHLEYLRTIAESQPYPVVMTPPDLLPPEE